MRRRTGSSGDTSSHTDDEVDADVAADADDDDDEPRASESSVCDSETSVCERSFDGETLDGVTGIIDTLDCW